MKEELKKKMEKREVFNANVVKMREAEGEDSKPTIEGCAIVFNRETVLYEGSDWREVEVIDPSCVTEEFLSGKDIKLNVFHDRQQTIARRTKDGKGNLFMEVKDDGLYFSATGDTMLFKETECKIRESILTGCSFEFYSRDYEVSEREGTDGKHEYVIRHKAFDSIGALTCAMDPAYEQTSIGVRELYREINHLVDENEPDAEAKKREAEAEENKRLTQERTLRELQVLTDADEVLEDL